MNVLSTLQKGTGMTNRLGNEIYLKGMRLKFRADLGYSNLQPHDFILRVSLIRATSKLLNMPAGQQWLRYDNLVDDDGQTFVSKWYAYGALINDPGFANIPFNKDGCSVLYTKKFYISWKSTVDTDGAGAYARPIVDRKVYVPMKQKHVFIEQNDEPDVYPFSIGKKYEYYWLIDNQVTHTATPHTDTPCRIYSQITTYFKDP